MFVNLGKRRRGNAIYKERATYWFQQNLNRPNSGFHGNSGFGSFEVGFLLNA
ncbi:hypothetical protein RHMOL_Rhmol10G0173000 [Rhododendron molle]|uniref:Uncharacterized protein n=1 Tax=Rhododendron molle TaxID=49168 RepID=A0ACC0M4D0_RHOML|nr:hypothetical protein RHMOL_Rhmol10G0173000 [Rhododendron molle]